MSQHFCPWQAFSTKSNICVERQKPTLKVEHLISQSQMIDSTEKVCQ